MFMVSLSNVCVWYVITETIDVRGHLSFRPSAPFGMLIWAVSAQIETGLVQNEGCVFEDHKVYFYKPIVFTVHQQKYLEDEGVSSH